MQTKNNLFSGKQKVFREIPAEKCNEEMKFHDAVQLIEHNERDEKFFIAREIFEKRRGETKDPEERGVCDYYLLRVALREHLLFENERIRKIYSRMKEGFMKAEKQYLNQRKSNLSATEQKILLAQVKAFYEIVDSYFSSLEKIYRKKGFGESAERTHEDKMEFRRRYARATGQRATHLAHTFFYLTSRYGHSFGRWGMTVVVFISSYAGVYALLDWLSTKSMFGAYSHGSGVWDYFYFSTVTMTTLGYGDIIPVNAFEKAIAMSEALLGYIMLSILITLIQKKISH